MIEFRDCRMTDICVELRDAAGGPSEVGWEFSGLASAFFVVGDDWWPDVMAPGCFAAGIPAFLERGFVGGLGHNWDNPIGRPLECAETPDGLAVRGTISDTQGGRDARTLMLDGVVRALSIGFRAVNRRWVELAELLEWWRGHGYTPTDRDLVAAADGVRLVERAQLYEYSPVAIGANPGAMVQEVRKRDLAEAGGREERLARRLAEGWGTPVVALTALQEAPNVTVGPGMEYMRFEIGVSRSLGVDVCQPL